MIDMIVASVKHGVAPLYVNCQQQDIFKIRDGIRGHGPQRVTALRKGNAQLSCGCSLPVSWMPEWEQVALRNWAENMEQII